MTGLFHGQGGEGVSGGEFLPKGHLRDSFLSVAVTMLPLWGLCFCPRNTLKCQGWEVTIYRVSPVVEEVERVRPLG